MERRRRVAALVVVALACAPRASRADAPLLTPVFVGAGVGFERVDWARATRGSYDVDEGNLPLASIEVRTEAPARLWLRALASASLGNSANVAGAPRRNLLAAGEISVGGRLRFVGPTSIVGYAGLGHAWWRRDTHSGSERTSREDHRFSTAVFGAILEVRGSERVEIAFDVALVPVFHGRTHVTSRAPPLQALDLDLPSSGGIGFRARAPITIALSREPGPVLSIVPWFERHTLRSSLPSDRTVSLEQRVHRTGVTLLAGWMF